MPLYEYHCSDCQSDVELLVRGGEQLECPSCGGERLTKLLSVVASPTVREGTSDRPSEPPRLSGGSCGPGCGCHPGL